MVLKNIMPIGARNLELLSPVATVGTGHGLPLQFFISNLEERKEGRDAVYKCMLMWEMQLPWKPVLRAQLRDSVVSLGPARDTRHGSRHMQD